MTIICHAAADVALLRCRHHRSLRAAATALPPSLIIIVGAAAAAAAGGGALRHPHRQVGGVNDDNLWGGPQGGEMKVLGSLAAAAAQR